MRAPCALLCALLCWCCSLALRGETLPDGWTDAVVAQYLTWPTSVVVLPDGRILIGQQAGQILVVEHGQVLATPFAQLDADGYSDRGLLGMVLDPHFATTHALYLFYTRQGTPEVNVIARVDASTDTAGPQTVLWQSDPVTTTFRNGGGMAFGADGKLYVGSGDGGVDANGQDMTTTFGKILRLNPDGSIPPDNPFTSTTTGSAQAIWCAGVRNPFTLAISPSTGELCVNDVRGTDNLQLVLQGAAGANFGWPTVSSLSPPAPFTAPLVGIPYGHSSTQSCCIAGAAFYEPAQPQLPPSLVGAYLCCDYIDDWLAAVDPHSGALTPLGTGLPSPIALTCAPDGSLYYLGMADSSLHHLTATTTAPAFLTQPAPQTVQVGARATFQVAVTGSQPLTLAWTASGSVVSGATSTSWTTPPVTAAEDGMLVQCIATNPSGSATSSAVALHVVADTAPVVVITSPTTAAAVIGGETLVLAAQATDAVDGALPPTALQWSLVLGQASGPPVATTLPGSATASYLVPSTNLSPATATLRLTCTAIDSRGLQGSDTLVLSPLTAPLTLTTVPGGLVLTLDGHTVANGTQPVVAGSQHTVTAPLRQLTASGAPATFASWSDGQPLTHTVSVTTSGAALTATYVVEASGTSAGSTAAGSSTAGSTTAGGGSTSSDPAGGTTGSAASSGSQTCGTGGATAALLGLALALVRSRRSLTRARR